MEENNDNSGEEREKEAIEIQSVAEDNSKRSGEAVEAAFLCKVCSLRIPVCKPWGDSERYDFVVDWGKGFWRVQVKGGSYYERSKYQVGAGGKGRPFTKEDMDFVVVHIVPEDLWYIVPIEVAEGLCALGSIRGRGGLDSRNIGRPGACWIVPGSGGAARTFRLYAGVRK